MLSGTIVKSLDVTVAITITGRVFTISGLMNPLNGLSEYGSAGSNEQVTTSFFFAQTVSPPARPLDPACDPSGLNNG